MPADEEINSDDDPHRCVDVELFILHPSLTPAEIAAALGLEGHTAHRVGDPRKTRKGRPLPGHYPDTRWRHSIRYELTDQSFADKIAMLVDRLMPHKEFLHHLRAVGGSAMVIVQFLGDGYLGDCVRLDTLSKMVDLQLDFGIECYHVPQS
jgi:hypothetical protein